MKGRRTPLLALVLPALMLFFVFACGDNNETASQVTTKAANATGSLAVSTTTAVSATQRASCQSPSGTAAEASMKQYPTKPATAIDLAKKYTAIVHTVRGDFTIELRPDLAPEHVNSFVFLARDHYFDGVTFHRVRPGFVAQTGDPTGTGSGGPGYTLPAEFTNTVPFDRGVVGMARTSAPNSAGSQWFVTYARAANLDGQYTVFGIVTAGMDVVDCITPRDPSSSPPPPPGDKIISIDVREQ